MKFLQLALAILSFETSVLLADDAPNIANREPIHEGRLEQLGSGRYKFSSELIYCHKKFVDFDLEKYNTTGIPSNAVNGWDSVFDHPFDFQLKITGGPIGLLNIMQAYQISQISEILKSVRRLSIFNLETFDFNFEKEINDRCAKITMEGELNVNLRSSRDVMFSVDGPENFKVSFYQTKVCLDRKKTLAVALRGNQTQNEGQNAGRSIPGIYFTHIDLEFDSELNCMIGRSSFGTGYLRFGKDAFELLKKF